MKKLIAFALSLCFFTNLAWSVPVHKGEKIKLVLQEAIDSETSHVGDEVLFETGDDVRVDDRVVIEKGAQASGEIAEVVPKRGMGRSGKLTVKGRWVTAVDGKRLRISFNNTEQAGGNQGWVWASALVFTPLTLFFKGNAAQIKKGTEILAYIDEDANIAGGSGRSAIKRWPRAETREKNEYVKTHVESIAHEDNKITLRPHLFVKGGKYQEISTGTFLLSARIENAQSVSGITVNGEPINFVKGDLVDLNVPLPIEKAKNKEFLKVELEDGTSTNQIIYLTRKFGRSLHGKIVKADSEGIFVNLGAKQGLKQNSCLTVYTRSSVRDSDGKLLENVDNDKGYVRVVDIHAKTARVEPAGDNSNFEVQVGNLVK